MKDLVDALRYAAAVKAALPEVDLVAEARLAEWLAGRQQGTKRILKRKGEP